MPVPGDPHPVQRRLRLWGLPGGPLLGLALGLALPDTYATAGGEVVLDAAARATLGVTVWMATWWMTEAIPVYVTALLPLVLFPWLGVASGRDAAAPYGHELIFLFMGGFLIALAMERWGLHRRIAFQVLRLAGTRPASLVAGFMLASALLSMWVSNTATAIMMLPVALSVAGAAEDEANRRFSLCLLLGVAYGCSIGGIATPIGTPPNVFLLSFLQRELGIEIGFARWMAFGLPITATFLPIAWWGLTRRVFPLDDAPVAGAAAVREAHDAMGPLGTGERSTAFVFSLAAGLWVFRPLLAKVEVGGVAPFAGLTDASIAIAAGLLLFLLPGGVTPGAGATAGPDEPRGRSPRALDWETALRLPWGILILFGGGLSLAAAIRATGVDAFLGAQVAGLAGLPAVVVVIGVVALVVFLTELTSNTATAATFVPLLAGIAPGLGFDPMLLAIPATVAASLAFMLPVATPPNAVVFGSGRVDLADMSRAGFFLNLVAIALVPLATFTLAALLFMD